MGNDEEEDPSFMVLGPRVNGARVAFGAEPTVCVSCRLGVWISPELQAIRAEKPHLRGLCPLCAWEWVQTQDDELTFVDGNAHYGVKLRKHYGVTDDRRLLEELAADQRLSRRFGPLYFGRMR